MNRTYQRGSSRPKKREEKTRLPLSAFVESSDGGHIFGYMAPKEGTLEDLRVEIGEATGKWDIRVIVENKNAKERTEKESNMRIGGNRLGNFTLTPHSKVMVKLQAKGDPGSIRNIWITAEFVS